MEEPITLSEVIRFLRSKDYLTGMGEVKEVPVMHSSGAGPVGVLRVDFQGNDLFCAFVADDNRKITGSLSNVLESLTNEELIVDNFGFYLHFRYDLDLTFGGTISINVLHNQPSYSILGRQDHFAVVCRNKKLPFNEHPDLLRSLPPKQVGEFSGWSACRSDAEVQTKA